MTSTTTMQTSQSTHQGSRTRRRTRSASSRTQRPSAAKQRLTQARRRIATRARSRKAARSRRAPQSPEQIRAQVSQSVRKAVSVVAGAIEGLDDTLTETELAETAESAMRQLGQTANKVATAYREEADELRGTFRRGRQSSGRSSKPSSRSSGSSR